MKRYIAILTVLCLLCSGAASITPVRIGPAMPSLTFADGSSDRVNFGSASSIDNWSVLTFCAWIKPSALTTNRDIFSKSGRGEKRFRVVNFVGAGQISATINRATVAAEFDSVASTLSSGVWTFLCLRYNEGGSAGNVINGYKGTLTSPVAEISYDFRDAGSGGTVADDTKDLLIGNNDSLANGFPGQIAAFFYTNTALSVAEMEMLRQHPFKYGSAMKIFSHLGWSAVGTGTQPDLSGNGNNGTVTGATQSSHVPIGRTP